MKTSPTVPLPRDPEELRARLSLLGRAWAFVATSQPNCRFLQGNTPQLWVEYLDYLLRPHCYGFYARDAYGNISCTPPWNLVLSYELEVRRKMVSLLTDGSPISEALPLSYRDPVVKEGFFTTRSAIGATSSKRKATAMENGQASGSSSQGPRKKGSGKGSGAFQQKGKGKGKRTGGVWKGGKGDCNRNTPDGKGICFRLNGRNGGCTNQKCPCLHVRGRCFQDHPMFNCNA